jgi:SAM-dependent methyltransferase
MHGLVEDPVVDDAFGAALRACYEADVRPGVVFEIERDDEFISFEDAARYFAPTEDWSTLERQACEEFTGRVLDLGCGAGRHASVLTAAGLDGIGVDTSPGAVEVARSRGVDAQLGSASTLPAGIAAVDTVALFGNNVRLLGTRLQAPIVLAELARVAAPGARVLASGIDPYATTNPVHIAYHDRNRQRGRMPGQLRLRVRHEHLVSKGSTTCSSPSRNWPTCCATARGVSSRCATTTVAGTWRSCTADEKQHASCDSAQRDGRDPSAPDGGAAKVTFYRGGIVLPTAGAAVSPALTSICNAKGLQCRRQKR